MMNKKVVLIFIALAIFLLMIIPSVKAADNNPLEVIDPNGNVQKNNTVTNGETNNIISNTHLNIFFTTLIFSSHSILLFFCFSSFFSCCFWF